MVGRSRIDHRSTQTSYVVASFMGGEAGFDYRPTEASAVVDTTWRYSLHARTPAFFEESQLGRPASVRIKTIRFPVLMQYNGSTRTITSRQPLRSRCVPDTAPCLIRFNNGD